MPESRRVTGCGSGCSWHQGVCFHVVAMSQAAVLRPDRAGSQAPRHPDSRVCGGPGTCSFLPSRSELPVNAGRLWRAEHPSQPGDLMDTAKCPKRRPCSSRLECKCTCAHAHAHTHALDEGVTGREHT